jgi:hypothetical protein
MGTCDYEDTLLEALASAHVSEELRRHIAACPACSETALVWDYLGSAQNDLSQNRTLPAAGFVWWRAQLAEKRRRAERSVAAIDLVQKLAVALLFVVVAILTFWASQRTADFVMSFAFAGAGFAVLLCLVVGVLYAWVRERI